MADQCEFCEASPIWRFRHENRERDYERFSCADHYGHVKRLIRIDWPWQALEVTVERINGTTEESGAR